jgi:hypothetical protein
MFEQRRAHARKRQALIAAHTELHERELVKLAKLTLAIAAGLRERGIPEVTASLVAETGLTIFKNAFERWVRDPKKHDLAHYIRSALADLRLVTAATVATPSSPTPRKSTRSRGRPGIASAT